MQPAEVHPSGSCEESSGDLPSARSQERRRKQAGIAAKRYARLGQLILRLSRRLQDGDRHPLNYRRIWRYRDRQRRISATWAEYWRRNGPPPA